MSLAAGRRFGPYEIIGLLGAGGMGEVYRARDARLHRHVALKILPAGLAPDLERRQRFEREGQAAARLVHPNVASVYDVGIEEGVPYIVSELVEGASLRERLRDGALPTREVIAIGSQVAEALAAAHQRSIVHRDIKPENILVAADGVVKVIDFGIAKVGDIGAADTLAMTAGSTAAGVVIGRRHTCRQSRSAANRLTIDRICFLLAPFCSRWRVAVAHLEVRPRPK